MNERFVCIKLDREERPDLDAIYMEACQAMTGHGRLAAERVPHARAGAVLRRHLLPAGAAHGHAELARRCSRPWPRPGTSAATRSAPAASGIAERLRGGAAAASRPTEPLDAGARSTSAVDGLRASYDAGNGGFGGAPKFPPASALEFLLRRGETDMSRAHAARDGLGRHVRPGRRRLRPLLGRPATGSCPTSRRCSTTTRCSRAPTCTAGR